ncbi:hypothetical protein Gasu2_28080 [Galdieria sulphuraria]|uniref:Uncharacterized protein n=1 Tax=Galdieria sulphuraria TaxID=130081 RepID=M2XY31_GALSU|nr:uncharacterized protein Gasu_39310 [Galdieria sulphuraria]EME28553.1 hypothetical protein Gasu_39310 [Galdieria sulphuraria]GJD08511.1 hypothetical protein Gasu2_28080 [Galdieria sulphuraria]|eukprot:XP_005705073.1 hypothetical protein Gasu_39310 [Galdieria sulphuraria]
MGVSAGRALKTFTDPVSFQKSLSGLQRVLGLLVESSSLQIAISDASRVNCAPFGFLYRHNAQDDAKILSRAFEFAQEHETVPFLVSGAVVGIRCENSREAKEEALSVRNYVEELLDNEKGGQFSSILYINQAAALKQAILRKEDYLRARKKIVQRLLANRPPGARLPPDPNEMKEPAEIITLTAVDILQYGLSKPL